MNYPFSVLGRRTQNQFLSMTPTLDMVQKSVSSWMPIALTTQCRAKLHAMLVQKETTTAVSATVAGPTLRKNLMLDIISFSLFVSVILYAVNNMIA